jgi:hypothetical protein
MEYVEGTELKGPLPLDQALNTQFNWPALWKLRIN